MEEREFFVPHCKPSVAVSSWFVLNWGTCNATSLVVIEDKSHGTFADQRILTGHRPRQAQLVAPAVLPVTNACEGNKVMHVNSPDADIQRFAKHYIHQWQNGLKYPGGALKKPARMARMALFSHSNSVLALMKKTNTYLTEQVAPSNHTSRHRWPCRFQDVWRRALFLLFARDQREYHSCLGGQSRPQNPEKNSMTEVFSSENCFWRKWRKMKRKMSHFSFLHLKHCYSEDASL